MRRVSLALGAALAVSLTGCASMLSASAPVVALLQDDLFTGMAVGYADRTGTIEVASVLDPSRRCVGNFAYVGSKTGTGKLTCNDGNVGQFQFNGITLLSGFGYGTTTRGGMSFTFGLDLDESSKYLTLPQGKALRRGATNGKPYLESI